VAGKMKLELNKLSVDWLLDEGQQIEISVMV
jgi:hypothetical protein